MGVMVRQVRPNGQGATPAVIPAEAGVSTNTPSFPRKRESRVGLGTSFHNQQEFAMTNSRADNHDRDKLKRWRDDLSQDSANSFPVHAVFLVSAEDHLSHDVFRAYRSSFEARNAGFRHLTIFGQHGVSSAVRRLLVEFSLPDDAIPSLALLVGAGGESVFTLPLPAGDSTLSPDDMDDQPWQEALAAVEAAAAVEASFVELESVPGADGPTPAPEPLVELVDRLLREL